jgi:hypothetical protein
MIGELPTHKPVAREWDNSVIQEIPCVIGNWLELKIQSTISIFQLDIEI